jgi:hypothetical protein
VNLRELKRSLKAMTPEQLRKLDSWLHGLLESGRKESGNPKGRRGAAEERRAGGLTYRLERVRCGKENCKCASGELHGPYCYAYWSEGGRTRSKYVGKKMPRKERAPSVGRRRRAHDGKTS